MWKWTRMSLPSSSGGWTHQGDKIATAFSDFFPLCTCVDFVSYDWLFWLVFLGCVDSMSGLYLSLSVSLITDGVWSGKKVSFCLEEMSDLFMLILSLKNWFYDIALIDACLQLVSKIFLTLFLSDIPFQFSSEIKMLWPFLFFWIIYLLLLLFPFKILSNGVRGHVVQGCDW